MTQERKEVVGGWWEKSKEIVTFLGGLIAVLVFVGGILAWCFGGLKLQSQIDLEAFKTQLNNIQQAQATQAQQNQASQERIIGRLDALPRPSDYANQEAHLSHLDAAVQALGDRMTADEVATARIAAKLDALSAGGAAGVRNPR